MTTASGHRQFTGWHMLAVVFLFFEVIISVNVGMAVVASTSWTGLVVTNSYVASQEFEEKRVAHEAQRDAGWISDLTYAGGIVRLKVGDAAGKAVDLSEVEALLNRPVGGHDDQRVILPQAADGSYEGNVHLEPGIWEATVTASSTALGPFELRKRFRVGGASP
jgi:nitrogen fixation protein FixH